MKHGMLLAMAMVSAAFLSSCGDDESRQSLLESAEAACVSTCENEVTCSPGGYTFTQCRKDCREMTLEFAREAQEGSAGDNCLKADNKLLRCIAKLSCAEYEFYYEDDSYRHACGAQERDSDLKCAMLGM